MTHSPTIRRAEFSRRTKLQAWDRSGGRCECGCGKKLAAGEVEYDHRISCEMGGDNSLDNCVVLWTACHARKTAKEDAPAIAKSRSVRAAHVGAKKSRNPIPGSKASRWKRTIDGRTVER